MENSAENSEAYKKYEKIWTILSSKWKYGNLMERENHVDRGLMNETKMVFKTVHQRDYLFRNWVIVNIKTNNVFKMIIWWLYVHKKTPKILMKKRWKKGFRNNRTQWDTQSNAKWDGKIWENNFHAHKRKDWISSIYQFSGKNSKWWQ